MRKYENIKCTNPSKLLSPFRCTPYNDKKKFYSIVFYSKTQYLQEVIFFILGITESRSKHNITQFKVDSKLGGVF